MNRTGNDTTGWARRLTALLITVCLVMAMALPVYAEADILPDVPDEVELLEGEPEPAPEEDTIEQLPDATAPPEQEADAEQDAATPVPEQSAEPEQPAPTETPEPTATAEPTLTPEPTATATVTPTPTVTPTATPEPTEQPEMNAEEAEDEDGALEVSTQSNQYDFTVYFAVPSSWEVTSNSQVTFNAQRGNGNGSTLGPYDGAIGEKAMSLVPNKITSKGQRIYKIELKETGDQTICPWGGYVWMQFTLGDSHKIKVTAPREEGKDTHFVKYEVFQDKYYDGDANTENGDVDWNNDNWIEETTLPNIADHTAFGGQKMVFENLSDSDLANVTAIFTEQDSSGNTKSTTVTIGDVAKNKKQNFEIPTTVCSSVQFFANNGTDKLSESYNFYEDGTDENKFLYNASRKYCFTYRVDNQSAWGTLQGKQIVYFDATFSWLSYENEKGETTGSIPYGMPDNNGKLWCYLTGDGKTPMTKQEMDHLDGSNIWSYEVPEGYTKIRFAAWAVENEDTAARGDGTAMMDIPADLSEPCFFADASDDVIYNGGNRGGYWAEKDSLRDAKEGKKLTDVVDISKATFKEEANTKYVSSTLYDYYTDYELNGNNRDSYNSTYYTPGEKGGFASQKSWVTFRQFDRALSDYYSSCSAQYPIYTGHFQPSYSDSTGKWGYRFETISAALNLWGFNDKYKKYERFMAINNSTINEDGNGTRYDYAYQGLVEDHTSTGDATGEPLLKGTTTVEPHFNQEFLSGTNSKNAKLGDVYKNVAFPFTKSQIFNDDTGVDYWYFDSQDTTLYLKQDSNTKQYFLKSSTENREQSRNLDSTSAQKTITKNGQTASSYGYFPFNETATASRASTYNYGFGTKLQLDFTLTDDGKVETSNVVNGENQRTNIKFFFSGDDDVWVFIDGQLALDVGGAHGKVSGLLEFGQTSDSQKNNVTAYVSKVKKGGTSNSDQTGGQAKSVKYNGETITFSAKGTTLELAKGQKHTLTMYYMERGMWESNMAVAFNFPDNNELQVQKEVNLDNVHPDFQKYFRNQKIFDFTIQNQATHYGEKIATAPDTGDAEEKRLVVGTDYDAATVTPATTTTGNDNIFKLEENPHKESENDTGQVLHWYARYTDINPVSKWRYKRYGIINLKQTVDISNQKYRFLTFQIYVEKGKDLSLNNLYLELLDGQNAEPRGQKGSLGTSGINGATYGSVTLDAGKWITVKLDLNKMKEQNGFNGNVTTIRVGDNYDRNIYFRNFTFVPQTVVSEKTGFTTKQEDIPDYGSATTGQLENATNAQYVSSVDGSTQVVDDQGRFVLEDGETITFSDQFRRGSYISLKEELNQDLYTTTWTVFENGQPVTSMHETTSKVTVENPSKSLERQNNPPKGPDDSRTENKGTEDEQKDNIYDGQKPTTANTIVFRSYSDPDEGNSSLTKLKVKYVNKVKTGGLKIQKQAATGETLTGTYTFKVTFTDVGGEGLEDEAIVKYVDINMSDTTNQDHTGNITGIPVGTRYTIEEVTPEDGSSLQSVTVPNGQSAHVINNTTVEGVIEEGDTPEITAIFTNTKRTLISIDFNKFWNFADGSTLGTEYQPDQIYIQLQRRLASSTNDADWAPVLYPTAQDTYVTIVRNDNGWLYTFTGLDQYPINGSADNNYVYRIVEGTVGTDGGFTAAGPDGIITIDDKQFTVSAGSRAEIGSGNNTTRIDATANGGTITGGSGTIELTNTLQDPKFRLDIIKEDPDDKIKVLNGVEFKLEKLVETTEGEKQWEVYASYKFDDNNIGSITATTGKDGKITNAFTNLKPGRYRLTETKAHAGYNLLSKPIEITFYKDGTYTVDDGSTKTATGTAASGYTVTLTVLNRQTPELPHTGADAPSLWLLIGMPLAVAGLLIFTFRYNRKGGRRH